MTDETTSAGNHKRRRVLLSRAPPSPRKQDTATAHVDQPKPNLRMIRAAMPSDVLRRAHHLFFRTDDIKYLPPSQNRVKIFGEYKDVPRKQCAYSSPAGMGYTFSGLTVRARDEDEVPLLRELRQHVEKHTGVKFNFTFINYYEDGNHHIGWHKDDESDMIDGAAIASLTFGAIRDFVFRLVSDHSVKHTVQLDDNMLCVMLPPTNKEWHHSLPKRARVAQPRVNLTFRQFKPQRLAA